MRHAKTDSEKSKKKVTFLIFDPLTGVVQMRFTIGGNA
jgi:hypothetical protein